MISALIKRRLWLWKNRLIPSIFFYILLPVFIFVIISLPLKNIIRFSLAETPYDIWVLPGLIFIIGSFSLYPLIYREYFELRIHRKVLVNIALTPYSKRSIIFSSLVVAVLEALCMSILGVVFYISFTSISLTISSLIFLLLCLIIYLFLLGNLYITISLIIDALTTMFLGSFMVFILILFGSGFLIEFSFFPIGFESLLKWIPLSIPLQIYHKFNSTGLIDWTSLSLLCICIYLWIILNSIILKRRLHQ